MPNTNKREKIPTSDVLSWLANNHPTLHECAEVQGDWVWLAIDLRADAATRAAIKAYGFRWAKRGHTLPSGRLGTWAHSCDHPTFFKRKKGGTHTEQQPTEPANDELSAALMALAEI